MRQTTSGILIPEDVVAFVGGGVSIRLASCDLARRPAVGRALAGRVAEDRRTVTLVLIGPAAVPLLDAVGDSRTIAAAFSQPTTHRSLQLKGFDATIGPAGPEHAAAVDRQRRAFAIDLAEYGFPERFAAFAYAYDPRDLVTIRFTCAAAFDQTPGPGAGRPLVVDGGPPHAEAAPR